MGLKRHIPNALTMVNLTLGVLSLQPAFTYQFEWAAYCIIAAAAFDLLDGMAARALRAQSDMGRELDSLADVVSFGVAPCILLFNMVYHKAYLFSLLGDGKEEWYIVLGLCFLIPIASALRLARFNLESSGADHFTGLPTPANALLIAAFPFFKDTYWQGVPIESYVFNTWTIGAFCILSSALLVSRVPLLAFKFKNISLRTHRWHLVLALLAPPLLVLLGGLAAPFIFALYLLCSLGAHLDRRRGMVFGAARKRS